MNLKYPEIIMELANFHEGNLKILKKVLIFIMG